MNPEPEIRRLLDIMPASGRMMAKIVSKPQQSTVIDSPFPLPWKPERLISVNFDLWRRLSKPQRDLLILRTQSWLCGVKWFKPELYQGVALAGVLGAIAQGVQGDAVGVVVSAAERQNALGSVGRASNHEGRRVRSKLYAAALCLNLPL